METDEIQRVGENGDVFIHRLKDLTEEEKLRLEAQNSRRISEAKAARLEKEAKRHWDIFYKRNETKFFKDRHWTTREFQELINFEADDKITFLELGCGVGNMIFPLVEEGFSNFQFYACDFSPRAVEFVKTNKLFDGSRMKAFCADLTTDDLFENMEKGCVDIASLIFVLSAIHPEAWAQVASVAYRALRPGGVLLFRDYGRYDMAQLRFKPGHKIADNFYMRQDGTRSYYFTEEELQKLFTDAGFEVLMNTYVQRRTVNFKEGIDVPRIFVQGKYRKPADVSRSRKGHKLSITATWGTTNKKDKPRKSCNQHLTNCTRKGQSKKDAVLKTARLENYSIRFKSNHSLEKAAFDEASYKQMQGELNTNLLSLTRNPVHSCKEGSILFSVRRSSYERSCKSWENMGTMSSKENIYEYIYRRKYFRNLPILLQYQVCFDHRNHLIHPHPTISTGPLESCKRELNKKHEAMKVTKLRRRIRRIERG